MLCLEKQRKAYQMGTVQLFLQRLTSKILGLFFKELIPSFYLNVYIKYESKNWNKKLNPHIKNKKIKKFNFILSINELLISYFLILITFYFILIYFVTQFHSFSWFNYLYQKYIFYIKLNIKIASFSYWN